MPRTFAPHPLRPGPSAAPFILPVVGLADVREQLVAERRNGADFTSAWRTALEALGPDRDEWASVLEQTADAWERAYRRADGYVERVKRTGKPK